MKTSNPLPVSWPSEFTSFYQPGTAAFPIQGDRITVLQEPRDFYDTLRSRILTARRRITLATLYVGHEEQDLIETLEIALSNNHELQVHVLFDALRGTRQRAVGNSPADRFVTLLQRYPGRFHLALYHTPDLHGLRKRLYPERYNESIGLMHIKAYIFDDDLILSGANLSRDYFSNRQDRYLWFQQQRHLVDYFDGLVRQLVALAYRVIPQPHSTPTAYRLVAEESPDPIAQPSQFRDFAYKRLRTWLNQWAVQSQAIAPTVTNPDTWLVPTVQLPPLGIQDDQRYLMTLLRQLDKVSLAHPTTRAQFTSAYFNIASPIQRAILGSRAQFQLLVAAPQANGFYNASGISKYIPAAYSSFEYDFYRRAQHSMIHQPQRRITVSEYHRPGWTFHGKGLWFYLGDDPTPSVTVVGSSNYGFRSFKRDLECQATVYTTNRALKSALHQEIKALHRYATPVSGSTFAHPSRWVPRWVKLVKPFIRGYF